MNERSLAAITRLGGILGESADDISSFGDPAAELGALLDRCGWSIERPGALIARGPDFLDLLNRLSTQKVDDLVPGRSVSTVLTTPKGRIVERLWCHHLGEDGVLTLGGPGSAHATLEHLRRFTFAEDLGIADASERFITLAIRGPSARRAIEALGVAPPDGNDRSITSGDPTGIRVVAHDLLSTGGFTVLADVSDGPDVVDRVAAAVGSVGGTAAGALAVEAWRIGRGLPAPGTELNAEHNPLEAGLQEAVSFAKGCYVGQEVVARLNTYDKVARRLMVVVPTTSGPAPEPGAPLRLDDREIGALTSIAIVPGRDRWIGLAYVKRAMANDGSDVGIGEAVEPATAHLAVAPVDPRR